jgi:hypothetical protein
MKQVKCIWELAHNTKSLILISNIAYQFRTVNNLRIKLSKTEESIIERNVWEQLPASDEKTDLLGWYFCVYTVRKVPGAFPAGKKRPGLNVEIKNEWNLKMSETIHPFPYMPSWRVQRQLYVCTARMAAGFPKVLMHVALSNCIITRPLWIKMFQHHWPEVTAADACIQLLALLYSFDKEVNNIK